MFCGNPWDPECNESVIGIWECSAEIRGIWSGILTHVMVGNILGWRMGKGDGNYGIPGPGCLFLRE